MRRRFLRIFIITFLLILTGIFYSSTIVEANVDEQVFHWINQDLKSPYLDQPMVYITHAGDGLTQVLTAGGFYLAGEKDTSVLLLSSLTKAWWVTQTLKTVCNRPRPGLVYEDVNYVGDYKIADRRSFPSGHTTSSFAVATVLSHQYPKYSPYFYTYSSLVGLSRVYNGVHHPSDVVAGAVLGYLIGKSTIRNKNLIVTGNFLVYSFQF